MATLDCPSRYEYTYTADSHTGNGPTEEAATDQAMAQFADNAEVLAKTSAITSTAERYSCQAPCKEDITVGPAIFRKVVQRNADNSFTVTVNLEVPVVFTCRRRQVVAALMGPSMEGAGAAGLASLVTSLGDATAAGTLALRKTIEALSGSPLGSVAGSPGPGMVSPKKGRERKLRGR